MAIYGQQSFRFGLAKEATRLTAEATPTKWYPIMEPDIAYGPEHLEDTALRGIKADFAPVAGRKKGTGKFKIIADAQVLGEFFRSLLGAPTTAQQGGTIAYQHTFTQLENKEPPTYTFFMDFGVAIKKYNGCVVKGISFTGPVDGLVTVDVDFLFISEASGSIGTPAFPAQKYLSFQHVDFKIAGSSNTDVKSWSLKLDNNAKHLMTMGLSQDAQNIVSTDSLKVSGDMVIIFTAETERAKFLANTGVAIRALMAGDTIASTYKYTVDLPLTDARYTAFPFGWEDKILAAKVNFKGYHNGTSQIIPVLINADVSY